MKLAFIGGGGFRVPLVYQAATAEDAPVALDEIALYDPDATHLEIMRTVVSEMGEHPRGPRLTWTTDLDAALRGADFIFCSIRVGGLSARVLDERIALDLGVLGQETTGPGGIAYALRTIPVMRQIAQRVMQLCPEAYFINFTNPAGIITESLTPILGDRVVGICDTPIGLLRRVERLVGQPITGFDYVGLNHLGWLRSVSTDRGDVLPGVLADDSLLQEIEEARMVGFDWVRQLGALPNEYLYYYYHTREAIAGILAAPQTRGEYVVSTQGAFFKEATAHPQAALRAWEATTHNREATYMAETRPVGQADQRQAEDLGGGYQGVAMAIMAALSGGPATTLILNRLNQTAAGDAVVAGLPTNSVVEVPCVVEGGSITPLPISAPTGHMLGLLQSVKAVEQLAIESATAGSADLAWKALAVHPLVDSVCVAHQLIDGYRHAHQGLQYLR
ncbi:MAG: 6-phospho-beta-glucosidase [Propionibacteriaceae bacterium]|jgi:6-phospho-beta-glucosidase|nr:6-phospho-beta-glucosidase [Propionibacteriaceae bacterium]